MAPAHLGLESGRDVVSGELAQLFRDDQLEGEVQETIAQLIPDRAGLAFAQRVIELEDLLDQIRPERLAGLRAIPGAPRPQVAHHRHRTSKR